MKGVCSKCGKEAVILEGHIGKRHKRCGNRKHNSSKANCGVWQEFRPPKQEEEKDETNN